MSCREIGERFLDFSWQPESRKKLLEHKEAIEFTESLKKFFKKYYRNVKKVPACPKQILLSSSELTGNESSFDDFPFRWRSGMALPTLHGSAP